MNIQFNKTRSHYLKIISIIIGILSIFEMIFSLSTLLGVSNTFIFIFIVGLAVLLVAILFSPKSTFPTDEVVPFDLLALRKSRVFFPCDQDHFKIANNVANKSFGKKNALPQSLIESWRMKNHLILTVLYDEYNRVVGYFDILPITKAFEDNLAKGIYSEKQLVGDCLLSPSEMKKAKYLYVGGIAVLDSSSFKGRKNAAILIRALVMYIKTFYADAKNIKVSAVAASKEGEKLLLNLGFTLEVEGSCRKDNHDYFSRIINKSDITNIERNLGQLDALIDYSAYLNFKENYGAQLKI